MEIFLCFFQLRNYFFSAKIRRLFLLALLREDENCFTNIAIVLYTSVSKRTTLLTVYNINKHENAKQEQLKFKHPKANNSAWLALHSSYWKIGRAYSKNSAVRLELIFSISLILGFKNIFFVLVNFSSAITQNSSL